MVNLYHLFEFCIPCIQDYGSTLKGNDWPTFYNCYKRMLLFYISCPRRELQIMLGQCLCLITSSVIGYVLVCLSWIYHTIFSEESGEIALSVLSHSQPETKHSDLKNTQDYWLLTRQRYLAVRQGQDLPTHKKHRVAGTYSLLVPPYLSFSG